MTGVVLVECIVLAANRGASPLTGLAARYTEGRAGNVDMYLPLWLARRNKPICGHVVRRRRAVRRGAMADQVSSTDLVREDDRERPSLAAHVARVTPSREWAWAPAAGRGRTRTRVLGDCALRSGRRSLRRPIG